ncbi:ABC transporter substrate-binding protein [Sorangium sp. So ce1078]|uniref:ABC transporter substrate-binding protein n=1 Tax=Sorangium sp. So ce1078 TaxID=3133329 RepID=UPI003F602FD9
MSTAALLRSIAPLRRAAAALLALSIAACSKTGDSPAPPGTGEQPAVDLSTVTLRIGEQTGIVKSGLEAAGQLDGIPYKVEWATFTAGPPLLEAINADAVDIGAVGDTPPIFAQAAGAPIRIVAATRNRPEYKAILIPQGSTIKAFRELKGKKVAVAKGSSAHYLLLAALRRDGLGMADIVPVYMNPNDAQPAFANGDVDAWAVWEPYVANNVRQGAVKLLDGTGLTDALAFQVSSEKALADPGKAAAIADYLARSHRTQEWSNDHKDVWARKFAEVTKLPLEVAQDMFARYEPIYVPLDDEIEEAQQKMADTFFQEGLLPQKIEVSRVFDERFNGRVSPR